MQQTTLFSFPLCPAPSRKRGRDEVSEECPPLATMPLEFLSIGPPNASAMVHTGESSATCGANESSYCVGSNQELTIPFTESIASTTFPSGLASGAPFPSTEVIEKEMMVLLQSVKLPLTLSAAHLFQKELKDFDPMNPKGFAECWKRPSAALEKGPFSSFVEKSSEGGESDKVLGPSFDAVPYAMVVDVLADISATSARLECVKYLTLLLLTVVSRCPEDLISVLYLAMNKLAPAHEGIELGVGDSLLIRAVAEACGMTEGRVKELYKRSGDLAEVAQQNKQRQMPLLRPRSLLAKEVYQTFYNIAKMKGSSVMQRRLDIIKRLLTDAKGPEVNFIIRALQQKMRIGLAESSVLTAMGYASVLHFLGAKRAVQLPTEQLQAALQLGASGLSRVYAEVPSLDVVMPAVMRHGWMILIPDSTVGRTCGGELSIRPCLPVRPQLASPTNGVTMIFQRFQGKRFTSEYKYDGERAQIHYDQHKGFHIFSRNSERQTEKFPDIISVLPQAFDNEKVTSFIIDSEVVAVHPKSGALQAFQVLQHRGRKNIDVKSIRVLVCVFAFDILYLNGNPTLNLPLCERRKLLHSSIKPITGKIEFATSMDSDCIEDIEKFLEQSISNGCEGLMIKALEEGAHYTPGKRSFSWLKLKKDYMDGVTDTLDLVPIGVYYGRGKRTGVFGGFLMACYDAENDEYQSICKIGTGLKDDVLEEVTKELQAFVVEEKPKYYRAEDDPDQWLRESVVWEVKAADLSISPMHTAALGLIDATRGIALRFPRYLRTREDKKPTDATTSQQVAQMYRSQSLALQQNAALEEEEDS